MFIFVHLYMFYDCLLVEPTSPQLFLFLLLLFQSDKDLHFKVARISLNKVESFSFDQHSEFYYILSVGKVPYGLLLIGFITEIRWSSWLFRKVLIKSFRLIPYTAAFGEKKVYIPVSACMGTVNFT